MGSSIGTVIYLVFLLLGAFALFWVIRLGVRFGLRDHAQWIKSSLVPDPDPANSAR